MRISYLFVAGACALGLAHQISQWGGDSPKEDRQSYLDTQEQACLTENAENQGLCGCYKEALAESLPERSFEGVAALGLEGNKSQAVQYARVQCGIKL